MTGPRWVLAKGVNQAYGLRGGPVAGKDQLDRVDRCSGCEQDWFEGVWVRRPLHNSRLPSVISGSFGDPHRKETGYLALAVPIEQDRTEKLRVV